MLIDNLMGPNYVNALNSSLNNLDYKHCIDTSGTKIDSDYKNSFASLIYDYGQKTDFSDYVINILFTALDKQEQLLEDLFRIRVGLIFRTPEPVNHGIHVDYSPEILSRNLKLRNALYYVNDSSGETCLYKEREQHYNSYTTDFNFKKSIKPIANRWYDFDGRRYHNSVSPTENDYRLAITFNYSIK